MGASKLGTYNKALRNLGERKLASLNEQREPRRYLDDEWDDCVLWCLYQGYWNFAVRLQQISADTSQTPNFGYQYVFTKPTDWVKTYQLADNDAFNPLARYYDDQNNAWFADISPLYVKFISSDAAYGWNLALWTPGFVETVAARLAFIIAPRLKQAVEAVDTLEKRFKLTLRDSLGTDAMDLAPGIIPYGTWVQSRAPRGSVLPIGEPFPGDQ